MTQAGKLALLFAVDHEAQKQALLLAPVKKNGDATNHQNGDANIKPHECAMGRGFTAIIGSAVEAASADPTLAQEPIVVALDQMGLHLPHRIQHYTNDNEQTRS